MAKEVKIQYDKAGEKDELYNILLSQLHGALRLLSATTEKRYIICSDGTVKEEVV